MLFLYSYYTHYASFSWLTDNGEIFADRTKVILEQLGQVEDEIFRRRRVS